MTSPKVTSSSKPVRVVVRKGTISSIAGGKSATYIRETNSPSKNSVMKSLQSRAGKGRFA